MNEEELSLPITLAGTQLAAPDIYEKIDYELSDFEDRQKSLLKKMRGPDASELNSCAITFTRRRLRKSARRKIVRLSQLHDEFQQRREANKANNWGPNPARRVRAALKAMSPRLAALVTCANEDLLAGTTLSASQAEELAVRCVKSSFCKPDSTDYEGYPIEGRTFQLTPVEDNLFKLTWSPPDKQRLENRPYFGSWPVAIAIIDDRPCYWPTFFDLHLVQNGKQLILHIEINPAVPLDEEDTKDRLLEWMRLHWTPLAEQYSANAEPPSLWAIAASVQGPDIASGTLLKSTNTMFEYQIEIPTEKPVDSFPPRRHTSPCKAKQDTSAFRPDIIPPLRRPTRPCWGSWRLVKPQDINAHYCVVGMTRSGKTVWLRMLMQSVAEERLVVYDDKSDMLSAIRGMVERDLVILNPFDARAWSWDIARDAPTPEKAREICRVLFHSRPGENPYFPEVMRDLGTQVMTALERRTPGSWRFIDFIASLHPANIQRVLSAYPDTRQVYETHLARHQSSPSDVPSTIRARTGVYESIAAAWKHASQTISITAWASSNSHLVLGNLDKYSEALGSINRVFLKLISETLLDKTTRSTHRTWVFLDELGQLGRIDSLHSLLNKGAGLGVHLALGFAAPRII